MIEITKEFLKFIEDYKEKVKQYKDGSIDPVRFKAFRVSMGIYEQREKETYMTRTRIPGGITNIKQLYAINEAAKKYANGKLHLTSRQDIQFQNVELDDTCKIMDELVEVGIITRGTGGNTVRNVACAPLTGVSEDDVFDVTPYAATVTNYLIKDPSTMNLPRKYKLAFSNSPVDDGNATIADLGFVAKIQDGKKGFEVYGGGGFGGNPTTSLKIADFIEDKEILYYAQAMKELFEQEGDRSNKHKARIRYIVYRLGAEKFLQLFKEKLEKVKRERSIDVKIEAVEKEYSQLEDNYTVTEDLKNVLFKQKQKGYYSVYIHPQSGNLLSSDLDNVLGLLKGLPYEASIRLATTQGFFVRDLKLEDAKKLVDIISNFSSKFNLYNSVTCAGAATCQLGLCLSQSLLVDIKEKFKAVDDKVKAALPRIFISGCPNSCGQHEKGAIGLSGRAKRTEDGFVPVYSVSLGGKVGAGVAAMGTVYGDVPAKKVPEFLLKLAILKSESAFDCFEEFINNKSEDIKKLIEQYSTVESFSENPDLYYEYGSCSRFSIEGRGPGECSTGVFDVMKLDMTNADDALNKFKNTKDSSDLYNAAVSSARVLLILKGIDTNKDREIFKEFTKYFINEGYLKAETSDLVDTLIDFKLGDIKDISDKAAEVEYVINKVKAMYDSLNGQLEITLPKEVDNGAEALAAASQEANYEIIDFRGVQCPINFVKVKIELSKIKSGDKRGFYLDDGAPIENVPKSVEKEGHKIVSIDTSFDGYNLLVIEKK
ncbi:MAG: sulfurtransferase TusA family protein [Bacillota bacterium]|nr:sulfurtransferase TusA family protein [Bacillota bacterium]